MARSSKQRRSSFLIIVAVPGNESRHSVFNRRARLEPNVAGQSVNVGPAGRNVARLYIHEVFDRLLSEFFFDGFDQVHELDWIVVADVVHAIGRFAAGGTGIIARPVWIGGSRAIDDAHNAFDNIVDIGEITAHVAVVEHLDGFAL